MGFKVPQLDSFCCGCSVKTGCLIILWMDLIGGITIGSLPLFLPAEFATNTEIYHGQTTDSHTSEITHLRITFADLKAWFIVHGVISAFASGLGLHAVYNSVAVYLLPALVYQWVSWLISIAIEVELTRRGFNVFTFEHVFYSLIGLIIIIYFWIILYSYYRTLKGTAPVRPINL